MSATLCDEATVTPADIGANFLLEGGDVGKNVRGSLVNLLGFSVLCSVCNLKLHFGGTHVREKRETFGTWFLVLLRILYRKIISIVYRIRLAGSIVFFFER